MPDLRHAPLDAATAADMQKAVADYKAQVRQALAESAMLADGTVKDRYQSALQALGTHLAIYLSALGDDAQDGTIDSQERHTLDGFAATASDVFSSTLKLCS